jgi:hypothetical protein
MEVRRRQRRAKSAGLDVRQVLRLLIRSHEGARQVGQVVNGPSVAAEDQRHRPRAGDTLQRARARTTARLKGLLRSQGRQVPSLTQWPAHLEALRRWAGAPMPPGLRQRRRRV